jgi:hypothetical protein
MFEIPSEYVTPYIVSNTFALALLVGAFWRPKVVRMAFALMFVAASAVNAYTAITEPMVYLEYGDLALVEWYSEFIYGPFAEFIAPMVLAIAIGQLACGVLLFAGGQLARLGALGGGIFLLAIAPLGVGSAFPFSVTCILALIVMDWRLQHPSAIDIEREERRERQRRMPLVSADST